jgi:hypothetical protein
MTGVMTSFSSHTLPLPSLSISSKWPLSVNFPFRCAAGYKMFQIFFLKTNKVINSVVGCSSGRLDAAGFDFGRNVLPLISLRW